MMMITHSMYVLHFFSSSVSPSSPPLSPIFLSCSAWFPSCPLLSHPFSLLTLFHTSLLTLPLMCALVPPPVLPFAFIFITFNFMPFFHWKLVCLQIIYYISHTPCPALGQLWHNCIEASPLILPLFSLSNSPLLCCHPTISLTRCQQLYLLYIYHLFPFLSKEVFFFIFCSILSLLFCGGWIDWSITKQIGL